MLKQYRAQAQRTLAQIHACRKPALRRSDEPDALLATDLPLLCTADEAERFIRLMEAQGWRVWEKAQWLLMDAALPSPDDRSMPEAPEGELGCCLSLLARHPGGEADPAAIRALAKAEEAGESQVERLCARWHRQWAQSLRQGEALPGRLLPYLCHAARKHTKENDG